MTSKQSTFRDKFKNAKIKVVGLQGAEIRTIEIWRVSISYFIMLNAVAVAAAFAVAVAVAVGHLQLDFS